MQHPRPIRAAYGFATITALALVAASASAQIDLPLLEEQAIKSAVTRVAPSVVRIETVGGFERVGDLEVGAGPTTGLIVSPDGYIVASAFNFSQKPDSILVTIPGRGRVGATLVATDESRQLVLLKVDATEPLPAPEPVPQGQVRVGQWTIAVGRTYDDAPSVSVGVVSALERIYGKAIQTDAKISPNNYGGPLIDISGRVFGVLVAMGPEMMSGGSELYDSGIGFAVPLAHTQAMLPRWTKGDLKPGVLGISLKGTDAFSKPAEIAAARAGSPAFKAGLRAGDTIVEAGGKPITRQTQFKHQLGPLYAGDKLKLVVLRGEKKQRIEAEVELVDKLPPYEFPFVGILPVRPVDDKPAGLIVRYVYPDSPAAAAGIEVGDQIASFAQAEIKSASGLAEKLREYIPEDKVVVAVKRSREAKGDSETLQLSLVLGQLPTELPGEFPPGVPQERPAAKPGVKTGVVPVKLPEFPNECFAYVPETYRAEVPHGIVLWLHSPSKWNQDELVTRWKPLCEKYDLILVAPKSTETAEWQPTEVKFIRRALDEVMKSYEIDPTRIVAHGYEGGGAIAYVTAFVSSDVIRAVAAVDAPLPQALKPPETNPVERIAIYSAQANKAKAGTLIATGLKKLAELKYPITRQSTGNEARYLNAGELAALVKWIDTLDRL